MTTTTLATFYLTPVLQADPVLCSLLEDYIDFLNLSEDIDECHTQSDLILKYVISCSDEIRCDFRNLVVLISSEFKKLQR